MIEPYNVLGLIPTFRGISNREEIKTNLGHIHELMAAGCFLTGLDLPVKLVVIPEGALQGFNDEIFDLNHEDYARTCCVDIPGEETDTLGAYAREFNVFIAAQARARHGELPNRYFNVGIIINPAGEIVLKSYKIAPLYSSEHSVSPHDIYDWWVERYGNSIDSFWPVADTEVGRIGMLIANDGSYPEHARALAMNGAEIICRGPLPHPMTTHDFAEIQNRARALDNNAYVLAPGLGPYFLDATSETSIDAGGGQSMIVDFRGKIIGRQPSGAAPSFVSAAIDIEALRHYRSSATVTNWMKDLRTELYQLIYSEPIYPKNLCLNRLPMGHEEYRREVPDKQVDLMHKRDIWKKPSR